MTDDDIQIFHATEGDAKKAREHVSGFDLTLVYRRVIKPDEPDFVEFQAYLDDRLRVFLKDRFFETLSAYHPDLAATGRPRLKAKAVLEHNTEGFLHHHVSVDIYYPRVLDPAKKGLLENWFIDFKTFNRVVREDFGLEEAGVKMKVNIQNLNMSRARYENYILKRVQ